MKLPQVGLEFSHDPIGEALHASDAKRSRESLIPKTIQVGGAIAAAAQAVLSTSIDHAAGGLLTIAASIRDGYGGCVRGLQDRFSWVATG